MSAGVSVCLPNSADSFAVLQKYYFAVLSAGVALTLLQEVPPQSPGLSSAFAVFPGKGRATRRGRYSENGVYSHVRRGGGQED